MTHLTETTESVDVTAPPAQQIPGPAAGPRIGIDLGGTKTEVAVLDPQGDFLLRHRVGTPRDDYPATVRTIARLAVEAEQAIGRPCSVGIGIPGTISPASGRVKNANSAWLNGRPLLEDLQAALGRPVRIQNDANCLALSEAVDGAATGAHCVFAIILGTGVGAGICVDGRVLTGRNAIAGEWGHNPLPGAASAASAASAPDGSPGPHCWCGRQGCIEAWLSGPALARDFAHSRPPNAPSPGPVDARAVCSLAEAGDAVAQAALDRYFDRLARSLAGVINLLDPDVIVVGGGLSNLDALYRELPLRWERHVFSDRVDTIIMPARHGDSSGVRGAAWLWP